MNPNRPTASTFAWIGLVAAFFILFLFYPVASLLMGALGPKGGITLKYFAFVLGSPLQQEALFNSLSIAVASTLGAVLVALPLAQWMTRYEFRGKSILSVLVLAPMILPPFVGAIGLRQLLGRFGTLNLSLINLGLIPANAPIDWLGSGGIWGVIFLQIFSLYPIVFLNLSAAMANIDPALREAAQNLGASPWRLFRTITMPLVMPGLFAGATIVFIWSFTDLGTPLIFGLSRVIPVQIFDSLNDMNTNPSGYALVVMVLLLTSALFLFGGKILGGRRYEMMGRGHSGSSQVRAGLATTLLIHAAIGGVILLSLLPHLVVILHSFSLHWFFTPLPTEWTLGHYREVFGMGLTGASIRNSLFYSSMSAFLDLILGVLIAWLVTRRRIPLAGFLDALAMLPLALPGLVLAFGYVAAFDFNISWLNPRQNPTVLLIVSYSVRRLPYIVRSACAGFQQVSVTLEEASASLGAPPWRTLRKITLPLISANLIAGTILTFTFAMLEVSDSLILAMREQYFPITKMIYQIIGRVDPNAPSAACALGVVGMFILACGLVFAGKILGQKLGQLFRA
jgi:iron(III) transport system permease protein